MKFNRSFFTAVSIVLLLAVGVTMFNMYNSASGSRKSAQETLTLSKATLSALTKQNSNNAALLTKAATDVASWNDKIALLQTTMAKANQSLTQSQKQFPAAVETIDYNATLMALAKSSHVTISVLTATNTSQADMSTSQFTFNANVFTVQLNGKVSDILAFVDKLSADSAFQTGAILPVNITIPIPLTQAAKDKIHADTQAKMISDMDASIKGYDRVVLIEQAILSMLGNNSNQPSAEAMTQFIKKIISDQFSPYLGDLVANAITPAIDQNLQKLAATLIDTVSRIYGDAIGKLFTDKNFSPLPTFTGPLADQINLAIQGIPSTEIPTVAHDIISKTLNSLVSGYISEMVTSANVDAAANTAIAAAEVPSSANLTVAVYSYKGA